MLLEFFKGYFELLFTVKTYKEVFYPLEVIALNIDKNCSRDF